jgi:hypothetical protein
LRHLLVGTRIQILAFDRAALNSQTEAHVPHLPLPRRLFGWASIRGGTVPVGSWPMIWMLGLEIGRIFWGEWLGTGQIG